MLTRRTVLSLASIPLPFAIGRAFATPETAPALPSLAGQLLVATDVMGDPRFAQTVILIARHSSAGALGIVIDHPLGWRPLAELIRAIGQDATGVYGQIRVFSGGPVQPNAGFVLHSTDYQQPTTLNIDCAVAMTSNPTIFADIAHHKGPAKYLIAFGYAGWGPGQLEGELAVRAWQLIADDPALVFDEDRADVWRQAQLRAATKPGSQDAIPSAAACRASNASHIASCAWPMIPPRTLPAAIDR